MKEKSRTFSPVTHDYVCLCVKCGGWDSVCIDDIDDPKWTARTVADYIKKGRHPQRITHEDFKKLTDCKCNRSQKYLASTIDCVEKT